MTISEIKVGPPLFGALLLAPDRAEKAAVIVLGGSEGGIILSKAKARHFAEVGIAALALPYYSPYKPDRSRTFPDLPSGLVGIDIGLVAQAKNWLHIQGYKKVLVYGVSKGAEMALLSGVYVPDLDGVMAIVPSDVVWEGWGPGITPGSRSSFSVDGVDLPFVPYVGLAKEMQAARDERRRPVMRIAHQKGREAYPERAIDARIPVERITSPVFLAGGGVDLSWNSGDMAKTIAERRLANALQTDLHVFPAAGHALAGRGDAGAGLSEIDREAQKSLWPATISWCLERFETHAR